MSVVSRHVPVDLQGRRAVVVGAGIAGLATALSLGERGAEVLLLEADPPMLADSAEEAFSDWPRRKVPQFRHSHAFLARLRNILLRAYPEIYRALLDEGARELRLLDFPPPTMGALAPEPGDEQLAAIGCRRATFEWVLRRHVESKPWARILSEHTVKGLVTDGRSLPEVRGVRVDDGRGHHRAIAVDLVVDASGRTSRAPQWLEDAGAKRPFEKRSTSAILYYTRFYRLRPGVEFPAPTEHPAMADFGWIKFAVFPADRSTFSITFATHLAFARLKILADVGPFEEMARTFPGLAPFADPRTAEPLPIDGRQVMAMGGIENCRRRFVDGDGKPLAIGFFAIGDSAYHTNPLYGRGSTQAFMHASLLGEALDAAAGDPVRAATLLDEGAREEIEPFYRASVAADLVASRRVGALPSTLPEWFGDSFFEHGILPASRTDPVVFRAFLRMFYMVETPEQAFFRPDVLARGFVAWLRSPWLYPRVMPSAPRFEKAIEACERAGGAVRERLPPPVRIAR
ncbi:MAG: NAD(P)/FAD-dependent oxidoreductase [Candidatus Binatia bacterium]